MSIPVKSLHREGLELHTLQTHIGAIKRALSLNSLEQAERKLNNAALQIGPARYDTTDNRYLHEAAVRLDLKEARNDLSAFLSEYGFDTTNKSLEQCVEEFLDTIRLSLLVREEE